MTSNSLLQTSASETAQASAAEVLKKHGKSFNLAGLFLGKQTFHKASSLYALLRFADDQIDEAATPALARQRLEAMEQALATNDDTHPWVALIHALPFELQKEHLQTFLRGMRYDTNTVAVNSLEELEDYCYCVAGVVGEMMCAAMQCQDSRAISHAIDLGIAMQMTNIARDVYADALLGRRYLPGNWLNAMSPDELKSAGNQSNSKVKGAIFKLLRTADLRYQSADYGIALLPVRCRLAILIASRVYRAIGLKIMDTHAHDWQTRTTVSRGKKAYWVLVSLLNFACYPKFWRYKNNHKVPSRGRPEPISVQSTRL